MHRPARGVLVMATLAVLLAGADLAGWWWATGRMAAAAVAWAAARRADGWVVRAGLPDRAGWPLRAELVFPAVTVATDQPGAAAAVAWQADPVRLVWTPWRPWRVDALAGGAQAMRFGAAAAMPFAADPLRIAIPLDTAGQAGGVTVRADRVSLLAADGVAVAARSAAVRWRGTDAVMEADGIVLPGHRLPFGATVQSLGIHARLLGAVTPGRDPSAALAAWRDNGGRLLLDAVAVQWGPLAVRGTATLGLDAAMAPEGSAAVQVTGYAALIAGLAEAGAITRSDARVVSTLLGLMAQPGANDVTEVDLPLSLKDRTVLVGAIPVLRLPPLKLAAP